MDFKVTWRNGAEAGLFLGVGTLVVLSISTGLFFPECIYQMKFSAPWLFHIMVVVLGLALWRLIACAFLYRGQDLHQWFVALIATMISTSSVVIAAGDCDGKPAPNPEILFSVTTFDLTVSCDGNGYVERTQILRPIRKVNRIIEMDYYSSGGFTKNDFKPVIHLWNGSSRGLKIDSYVESFEPHTTQFVEVISGGKHLEPGQEYIRETRIEGKGAFVDQVADGLIVVVNNLTPRLEISVVFNDPCEQNPNKTRVVKMKDAGHVFAPPIEIPSLKNTDTEIKVLVAEPKIGDQYGVFWEYKTPPRS